MSIPAVCTKCHRYIADVGMFSVLGDVPNVSFKNVSVSCPYCGGKADISDGTYEFINSVLVAFRAQGVRQSDILEFRSIVQAVQTGELSSEDAAWQITKMGESFARIWKWVNENSGGLTVLLAIIMLYFTIFPVNSAQSGENQARTDVVHQGEENSNVRRETWTDEQVRLKIHEGLQQQGFLGAPPASQLYPTQRSKPQVPAQKQEKAAPANRHERRKATKFAKRQPLA